MGVLVALRSITRFVIYLFEGYFLMLHSSAEAVGKGLNDGYAVNFVEYIQFMRTLLARPL